MAISNDGEFATAARKELFQLWFEFLAISPSYETARKYFEDRKTDAELPGDWGDVLAVYDDLGDVQRTSFEDWMKRVGRRYFGFVESPSTVSPIGLLGPHPQQVADVQAELKDYVEIDWPELGYEPTAILAVPLSLSMSERLRQIRSKLERYETLAAFIDTPPVKYPLLGQKPRLEGLQNALDAVRARAKHPSDPIWKVGLAAGISTISAAGGQNAALNVDEIDSVTRNKLHVVTSRALARGHMLAENAARGRFPKSDTCEHALDIDYEELGKRLKSRKKM